MKVCIASFIGCLYGDVLVSLVTATCRDSSHVTLLLLFFALGSIDPKV